MFKHHVGLFAAVACLGLASACSNQAPPPSGFVDPAAIAALKPARVVSNQTILHSMRVPFTTLSASNISRYSPCWFYSHKGSKTSICVVSKNQVKVSKPGYKYVLPAVSKIEDRVLSTRVYRAPLRLPSGPAEFKGSCKQVECQVKSAKFNVSTPRVASCKVTPGSRLNFRGKTVALTFDDGPGVGTLETLRILKRHNVPGTFFVVGTNLYGNQNMVKKMHMQGHEVANHTFDHHLMSSSSYTGVSKTSNLVKRSTGYAPCAFRPPYGQIDPQQVAKVGSLGMGVFLWDVDPRDWAGTSPAGIYQNVVSHASRGSILLFHDGNANSNQILALPRIIKFFKAKHYRFVTVSQAAGKVKYR